MFIGLLSEISYTSHVWIIVRNLLGVSNILLKKEFEYIFCSQLILGRVQMVPQTCTYSSCKWIPCHGILKVAPTNIWM